MFSVLSIRSVLVSAVAALAAASYGQAPVQDWYGSLTYTGQASYQIASSMSASGLSGTWADSTALAAPALNAHVNFDQTSANSAAHINGMAASIVRKSGDVSLTFEAQTLAWLTVSESVYQSGGSFTEECLAGTTAEFDLTKRIFANLSVGDEAFGASEYRTSLERLVAGNWVAVQTPALYASRDLVLDPGHYRAVVTARARVVESFDNLFGGLGQEKLIFNGTENEYSSMTSTSISMTITPLAAPEPTTLCPVAIGLIVLARKRRK